MAMKLSAFNKLRKTMMMTTSSNDNEALNALRIANKVIADEGYTWEDVFGRLVTVQEHEVEAAAEEVPEATRITEIFTSIQDRFPKSYNSFIQSLPEQGTASTSRSQRQKSALYETAQRLGV